MTLPKTLPEERTDISFGETQEKETQLWCGASHQTTEASMESGVSETKCAAATEHLETSTQIFVIRVNLLHP